MVNNNITNRVYCSRKLGGRGSYPQEARVQRVKRDAQRQCGGYTHLVWGGGGAEIKRDAKRQRGATLTFFQGMWAGVGVTPNVSVSLHSPCLRGWGQEFSVTLSVSVGLHSPFFRGWGQELAWRLTSAWGYTHLVWRGGVELSVTPSVSVGASLTLFEGVGAGVKCDAQRQRGASLTLFEGVGGGVKCDAQRQRGASLTLFEGVGGGVKCDAQRQCGASLTLFERVGAGVKCDAQRQRGASLTLFERMVVEVRRDAQRQCGATLTLFEGVGAGVKCDAQRQRGASLTLFERMAAEVRRDAQRQCGATLTLFEGVGAGVKCDAQRQRGATCGRVDVVHGTATGGAPAVRQVDVRHAVQAALGIIHGGQGWKRTKRTKLTQQIFYCTSRIVFYACSIPANTNHLCDICIMLDQRRRRLGRRHTNVIQVVCVCWAVYIHCMIVMVMQTILPLMDQLHISHEHWFWPRGRPIWIQIHINLLKAPPVNKRQRANRTRYGGYCTKVTRHASWWANILWARGFHI